MGGPPDERPLPEIGQTGIALVKNDTGSDAERFAVLGIDTPLYKHDDNADEFKNALPDAEVFWLSECGHEPPLEQTEKLAERVNSFFTH